MAGAAITDIFNLALSALGTSLTVQNVNEQSVQAGVCTRYYNRARLTVLEQCYWSFATKALALALLLDQETLTSDADILAPGWRYIYARPADCIKAQAVTTLYGLRVRPALGYFWNNPALLGSVPTWGPWRPPWAEMTDEVNDPPQQSIDIVTDQDDAWLVYTTDPPVAIYPETMVQCVALHLAVLIAGPISANGTQVKNVREDAQLALSRALAQNLNEQQTDPYPDSPSVQARA